jgi:hypothetical protein
MKKSLPQHKLRNIFLSLIEPFKETPAIPFQEKAILLPI